MKKTLGAIYIIYVRLTASGMEQLSILLIFIESDRAGETEKHTQNSAVQRRSAET